MTHRTGLALLLLAAMSFASAQSDGGRVVPRANVVAYGDENDIAKLAYRDSPYYMELAGTWKQHRTDTSILYSRQLDAEKVWRDYRVYLNVRCGRAVRVKLNDKEVGRSADSRLQHEFLLSPYLKWGKSNTLTIEALLAPREAALERDDLQPGLNGDPYLLFKSDPEIADFTLTADYDAATGSGTLALDLALYHSKQKGKYYVEAEIWSPNGRTFDRMGRWVVFDRTARATLDLNRSWASVSPWSAETPSLYTLVLRLRNEKMEEEEVIGARFGFRTVTVQDGTLRLNGHPLTIKGVAYGIEHTEGYASRERIRQDLLAMKASNVNAVRTARYSPMEPWFYELCDELGLYVVCDANLMPASTQHHAVATDKAYLPLFEQRVENLHGIYKNYTSIIAWSLGDSRDNGICMQAAYRRLKALESKRPVLFSGADYSENTDLIAFSHPTLSLLRQALLKSSDRPLLLTASASVDNFERLEDIWSLVENHRQLQGGFFDTWPLPATQRSDLANLYAPFDIRLTKQALDEAEFAIFNRNDFSDFSAYTLEYTIFTNLRPNITAGDLPVALEGGGADKLKLNLPPLALAPGEELLVRFDLIPRQPHSTRPTAPIGSVVIPLEQAPSTLLQLDRMPPIGTDTGLMLLRHELYFVGHEDWHAETIGTIHRTPSAQTRCIDRMVRYTASDGTAMCDLRYTYTLYGSGDVVVDYTVSPSDRMRGAMLLPAFKVWHPFDSIQWFGLDRQVSFRTRHSGIVGIHNANTTATPLVRKCVRWCAPHQGSHGLFVQVLGQQATLSATNNSLVLEPGNTPSFRIHLRPYNEGTPIDFVGHDFPRVSSGIVEPPVIVSSRSQFDAPMAITIKAAANCEVRYTLDGTDPTATSPLYSRPFTIATTTTVKAQAFGRGLPPSFVTSRKFSYDYIVATTFSRKPNTPYNLGADTLLFDGQQASIGDLTRGWLGFSGSDVTTTLTLSKQIAIDTVVLRYAHNPQLWAFAPRAVSVSFSTDGQTYGNPIQVELEFDPTDQEQNIPQVVELRLPVGTGTASHVKVVANTISAIPAWHRAKGLKPWLLMDEIRIVEQ